ncbi:hypothetical protein BT63DRAFT_228230 [Microthyrium microscopicum]|uniref:F-box domain-containing protein n=1 Tax=Microthyrium microscopicum TaxID=703497 RepID=A0A6A6UEP8_9PEZI|nr:hypothetical protein BT63DRAFT_228230 [Microthyrium microscopicum]
MEKRAQAGSSDARFAAPPKASLQGIPVELKLEIVQYLGLFDKLALRGSCLEYSFLPKPTNSDFVPKIPVNKFRVLYCEQCKGFRPPSEFNIVKGVNEDLYFKKLHRLGAITSPFARWFTGKLKRDMDSWRRNQVYLHEICGDCKDENGKQDKDYIWDMKFVQVMELFHENWSGIGDIGPRRKLGVVPKCTV